jgi:hypothetical protein
MKFTCFLRLGYRRPWQSSFEQSDYENALINATEINGDGIRRVYMSKCNPRRIHIFFLLLLGIQIQIVLCWFFGFSVFRLVFTHSSFFLRCSFFYNWACEWNPSRMRISFRTLIFLTRPLIFWKYISRILEREYWLNG